MFNWIVDLCKLPMLLVVAALGSNMLMQSNASTDNVSVYYIYRSGVRIGSKAATSYTDPAAQPNMQYSYTGGNEPSQSLASLITTGAGDSGGVEVGPSAALFARPYYRCTRNFYVATNGNDSRTVAQAQNPATPWLTIQHADDSKALTAGDCVNIAPGTYSSGVMWLRTGGRTSSPSGYVVYRSSTLGGARLRTNTSNGNFFIGVINNYIMFDGLDIDCNSNDLQIGITTGNNTAFAGHHVWVTNSSIHGCGLSGIQTGPDGEYYWFLHNHIYNNSSASGFYGSGISVYQPGVVSPYTPTAMDLQWAPYHVIINYNISHDNFNPQGPLGANNTDGNGIILDDWSNHFRGGPLYSVPGLVVGNVVYHNGGKGIQIVFGAPTDTLIANNTAYNNNWDTFNPGTFRGEINGQDNYGVIYKNNIAYAVPGAGILANNTPYASHLARLGSTFTNNIGFGTGKTSWVSGSFDSLDVFSCSTNKCNSNPAFVAARSNNFALQAGSPAIAYGQTYTYGPAAPGDSGACAHTLTTCP